MAINKNKLITKAQQTEAEFQKLASDFRSVVQRHLDGEAQKLGYDSMATAVSYADEPAVPRFQQEGRALRQWRSLVWQYCYTELAKVKSGERQIPTWDVFAEELPALEAPSDAAP